MSAQKKSIKINFVGIPDKIGIENLIIYKMLSERYDIQIDESPDYLFFGVADNYNYCGFPGIRIFYPFECFFPDLNTVDYALTFTEGTCKDRLHRIYPSLQIDYIKDLQLRPVYTMDFVKSKTKFCNYIYSHRGMEKRKELFETISRYKHVDSAGKYLNNMGGFTPGSRESVAASFSNKSKIEFQRNYKFTIACENYSFEYYNTEKLTDAFYAGTIPIYYGDPKVAEIYNEKAFINCHNYSSFDEVIRIIEKIDNNNDLYLDMLNQPAFVSDQFIDKEMESTKAFLFHIFDQPYEEAFRRPKVIHSLIHEEMLLEDTRWRKTFWFKLYNKFNQIMKQ